MSEESGFDIDAGVDSIASDMGWNNEEEKLDDDIDSLPGDDDEVIEEQLQDDPAEDEIDIRAAPASWSKEQHENWAKVPKEAQDYIELREKQMLDGIEQYKQGHAQALELQRTVEPFRDMLQQFGINETQALANSLTWNKVLTSGTLEQRQEALIKLGNNLGLIPQEGQAQPDPQVMELQQRLDRFDRQEQQRAKAEQDRQFQSVTSDVEKFANDPAHPHFEMVSDDIMMLLKAGMDLPTAYEKAVWANPITRAKEIDKASAEREATAAAKRQADAKAARKASSGNVRGTSTNKQSSEPLGSWDSTMADTLAAMRKN